MATTTATRARRPSHLRAEPVRRAQPADTCRLYVEIRGELYTVLPNHTANGLAWRLKKPDGTLYDIADGLRGPECDCPDYVFRRAGLDPRGCKHLRAAQALGLLNPPCD